MSLLDKIDVALPKIGGPKAELTREQKLRWTVVVAVLSTILIITPISVVFSNISLSKIGIVALAGSVTVLMLFNGSRFFKFDLKNAEQNKRFLTLKKTLAIFLLIVLSLFNALVYGASAPEVAVLLIIGGLSIIYLDEVERKYGLIGSGLGIFFAIEIIYSLVRYFVTIGLSSAAAAATAGGIAAISNEIQSFLPIVVTALFMWLVVWLYKQKIGEALSAFINRDDQWTDPINRLFALFLPVLLASALLLTLTIWGALLGNSPATQFIAHYSHPSEFSRSYLQGGVLYLIAPIFPLAYPQPYGIGGISGYISYIASDTSNLILPSGQVVVIPELAHILFYLVALVLLTVIFGRIIISAIGMEEDKVDLRLSQIYGGHGLAKRKAIKSIKNELALTALIFGLSIISGSVVGGFIFGAVSLYVIYNALWATKKS